MASRTFDLTVTVDAEDEDEAGFARLSPAAIKRNLAAAIVDELEPIEDDRTGISFFVTDAG